VEIRDAGTQAIYNGQDTKVARKCCPVNLWTVARRKLDMVNVAVVLSDLRVPPGNQLEALKGDRAGQHSIRINDQYRVCFTWTENGATGVEIVDYH
jgi:proteic killer suppression protein